MTTLSELRERLEKAAAEVDKKARGVTYGDALSLSYMEDAIAQRNKETHKVLLALIAALEKESAE